MSILLISNSYRPSSINPRIIGHMTVNRSFISLVLGLDIDELRFGCKNSETQYPEQCPLMEQYYDRIDRIIFYLNNFRI